MKTHIPIRTLRFSRLLLVLLTLRPWLPTVFAQGTAFTYQGQLAVGGSTTNGVYDFTFTLFGLSSGGGAIAGPVTNAAVGVTNGLFTTTLDLGANFPGADRWLEIGARSNGVGTFTRLAPRQKLTPSPYAITAGNLSGSISAGQLSGTIPLAQLPAAVVTNNQSGVNFSGSFTGNAAGLTNVPVNALVRTTTNFSVVAWGFNCCGQINVPAGLTSVAAVAAGYKHSLALKADGT